MASNPQLIATPKVWVGQVSTANSNLDGTTGTYATIVSGGTNNSLVEYCILKAATTTTAGMVRLFVSDGSSTRMVSETTVGANTPTGTNPAWSGLVIFPLAGVVIPNGGTLIASTENAEAINIIACGGDF